MKTMLTVFLTVMSLMLHSDYYHDEAKRMVLLGDYNKAIELYSLSISLTDPLNSDLSVYIDRGDAYFAEKEFLSALNDYQFVISEIKDTKPSNKHNLLIALAESMFCYLFLNDDLSSQREFDRLVNELELLRENEEAFEWIENYIYSNSCLNYALLKKPKHLYPESYNNIQAITNQTRDLPDATPEEHCQSQCLGYAFAASIACSKVPNIFIQALCAGAILGLEQICARCCKGKGFWENCVKPLRRLYHDPEHYDNPAPHPYE